jgi:mRNA interferase HigB
LLSIKVAEHSRFVDFADLRQRFASADYVPPFTVFEVGGDNRRIGVSVGTVTREDFD